MIPFVHLRAHSQYSILDATASVEELAEKAASHSMAGIALTDHGNLFGAVDFYKACQSQKIRPILGCECYVAPHSRFEKARIPGMRAGYNLPLLAKTKDGYRNLCLLSSKGYLEGFYYYPRIDFELLKECSKGLICLDGALGSRLAHEILNGSQESVKKHLHAYLDCFGKDYYLDLQRHEMQPHEIAQDGMEQESWVIQQYEDYIQRQKKVNDALIAYSKELSIPLVATQDIHYLERQDWSAHEILLNVQSGEPCELWQKDSYGNPTFKVRNPKRETYSVHSLCFLSQEEMQARFSDVPEALANTSLIAEQCKVEIDFKTKHYPVYYPPASSPSSSQEEREKAVEAFLWQLCEEGIEKRYTKERLDKIKEIFPDKEPLDFIRKRLEDEMSIIVPKGMADYLLIVWDFINWAKKNGIPMGPGRGSGAGSIVLFLIGITDIEPLRFHLFFERFINPERISYPDIDVDICMERRAEVIAYTLNKYGKENVAQIITFGTMKAKMVLKDVGRVLSVPLAKVNQLSKLIPDDLNITLEKALEKDKDLAALYESDVEVKTLFDSGRKLEGSIRSTGIHAAGIIISGSSLMELIPVCNAKDSEIPVTQFSMKPVELVGMLKVDFLGLKTLTAIQICVDAIERSSGKKIDWVNLPLDDKPTFDLLNQGKTMGIFQLESGGMQDLAKQLHLDKFEEIIAVGALYRPGPMDMIPSFINRKHGREPIEYDHPWMKEILSETYGIMVYQEQVMQIASKLANFSLGEGDVLRRAMGKKDMDQMAKQREKFRLGALENEIGEETSMLVFDKMEKFASYGFNKSHAAAYGYVSYVTAYLKANYPREWMAALMTCDRDDLTKVAKFIRECKSMGIAVLPPDVNESGNDFAAAKEGIRFAISGIKGVGEGVVETILEERNKNGFFKSFYDFFKRVDVKKIGKKTLESLVDAGGFDFTSWPRESLLASIEPMFEIVSREQKEKEAGVLSLFALIGDDTEKRFSEPPKNVTKIPKQELLKREKVLLGFFLTAHPMDDYRPILQRLSCIPIRKVSSIQEETILRSAFIVESVQVKISAKSQKKFAILVISDGVESRELPIWPELYEEKSHLLQENQLLYAVLQIDKKEEELRLNCRWMDDLTKADEKMINECDLAFDRAKQQMAKSSYAKTDKKTKPHKVEEKQPVKSESSSTPFLICLDANRTKLSHVLMLKEILQEHGGKRPVKITFSASSKTLATLHVDVKKGIEESDSLLKALQAMDCVIS